MRCASVCKVYRMLHLGNSSSVLIHNVRRRSANSVHHPKSIRRSCRGLWFPFSCFYAFIHTQMHCGITIAFHLGRRSGQALHQTCLAAAAVLLAKGFPDQQRTHCALEMAVVVCPCGFLVQKHLVMRLQLLNSTSASR